MCLHHISLLFRSGHRVLSWPIDKLHFSSSFKPPSIILQKTFSWHSSCVAPYFCSLILPQKLLRFTDIKPNTQGSFCQPSCLLSIRAILLQYFINNSSKGSGPIVHCLSIVHCRLTLSINNLCFYQACFDALFNTLFWH